MASSAVQTSAASRATARERSHEAGRLGGTEGNEVLLSVIDGWHGRHPLF
jgi:hypothetical protein